MADFVDLATALMLLGLAAFVAEKIGLNGGGDA